MTAERLKAGKSRDPVDSLLDILLSRDFAETVLRLADGNRLARDVDCMRSLDVLTSCLGVSRSDAARSDASHDAALHLAHLFRSTELASRLEGRLHGGWLKGVADVLDGVGNPQAPPTRTAQEAAADVTAVYRVFHARAPEPDVLAIAPLTGLLPEQAITAIASGEFAERFAFPLLAGRAVAPSELPAPECIERVTQGLGLLESACALALNAKTWPDLLFVLLGSAEVRARLETTELEWSLVALLTLARRPAQRALPAPDSARVSRDDVVKGYRLFLGREPESEACVTAKLGHSPNALMFDFLMSDEFGDASFAQLFARQSQVPAELRTWAAGFLNVGPDTSTRIRFTDNAASLLAVSLADRRFQAQFDTEVLAELYTKLAVVFVVHPLRVSGGGMPSLRLTREAVLAWGGFDAAWYAQARGLRGELPTLVDDYLERGERQGVGPNAVFKLDWYRERRQLAYGGSPLAHYLEHGARLEADPGPSFDASFYRRLYGERLGDREPLAHYLTEGWRAELDPNPAFDTAWYVQTHFDAAEAADPLSHYLVRGMAAGAEPHPLFDSLFYVRQLARDEPLGSPLEHYLATSCERRASPCALVQSAWYRQAYSDRLASGVDVLWHYHRCGVEQGTAPNPCFDGAWYRATYADAARSRLSPAAHYRQIGAGERRRPHPLFDTTWYARAYPDVAELGQESLSHFLTLGWREGRDPNSVFDVDWHMLRYPDVARSGLDPLGHYAAVGWRQGRAPNAFFDPAWYRKTYPEVAEAGIDPLRHYLEQGWREGCDPSPRFSTKWYLAQHPEILSEAWNPLGHYIHVGRAHGWRPKADLADALLTHSNVVDSYARWRRENEASYATLKKKHARAMATVAAPTPLISVLTPTYNTPVVLLDAMVESVQRQTYPHWELCIVDDASTDSAVVERLHQHAAADPRIRIAVSPVNQHISLTTNLALQMAKGAWIVPLDHDDLLSPDALFEVAEAINQHPQAQVIYSDEDKIDMEGQRSEPFFKPDISPELLLAQNYINHLCGFSTALVRRLGGWRKGFEGSQDHDLLLRALDEAGPGAFAHIPKVLYHWRATPGSTAVSVDGKPYALTAGRRAVAEHLARIGRRGEVEIRNERYHVTLRLSEPPPTVGLVIPTCDQAETLRACVDSIRTRTDYSAYRLLIVDNDSREPATHALFDALGQDPRIEVVAFRGCPNYPAMNNFGVKRLDTRVVGLFTNTVEVIAPGWMGEMAAWAIEPEIGCVGAKLLHPNDTVQHAGVVLGIGGVAGTSHKDFPRDHPGYFGRLAIHHNVSAVTGACLFIERRKYLEVGGLDELLAVSFNDVDFGLRVREAGYRNLVVPTAELYHHESRSRGYEDDPEKAGRSIARDYDLMRSRWGAALDQDPYYSPHLSRAHEDYRIALRAEAF